MHKNSKIFTLRENMIEAGYNNVKSKYDNALKFCAFICYKRCGFPCCLIF